MGVSPSERIPTGMNRPDNPVTERITPTKWCSATYQEEDMARPSPSTSEYQRLTRSHFVVEADGTVTPRYAGLGSSLRVRGALLILLVVLLLDLEEGR